MSASSSTVRRLLLLLLERVWRKGSTFGSTTGRLLDMECARAVPDATARGAWAAALARFTFPNRLAERGAEGPAIVVVGIGVVIMHSRAGAGEGVGAGDAGEAADEEAFNARLLLPQLTPIALGAVMWLMITHVARGRK